MTRLSPGPIDERAIDAPLNRGKLRRVRAIVP